MKNSLPIPKLAPSVQLACFLLLTTSLFLAGAAMAAAPGTPDPVLESKVKAAHRTLIRVDELRQLTLRTRASAQQLNETGDRIRTAWTSYQQSAIAARNSVQQAQDCLPSLRLQVEATSDAVTQLGQTTERSQQAVQAIAQAQAGELAPAAQTADQRFQQRTAAERALKQKQKDLEAQARRCGEQTRHAEGSGQRARRQALGFVDWARQMAPQRATVEADWQAAARAAQAAEKDRLLQRPPSAPMPNTRSNTERLERALADLPWPAGQRSLSTASSALLVPYGADLMRYLTELTRLQDANAYIDLATVSAAGDCASTPCADFASERRDLALRTDEARSRVEHALAQWRKAPVSLQNTLDAEAGALQTTARELEAVAQAWAPGVDEATATGQAIAQAAARQLSVVEQAHAQAEQAWAAAYLQAYGTPPPIAASAGVDPAALMPSPAPPGMGATAAPSRIQSHAYELFSTFDGEAAGFGAYTYVLLRSEHDMETPAVRHRFLQLLGSLQKLPAAHLVARDQTRRMNVFCVPVKPGSEEAPRASDVAYASDLGQQLKMRAQNGLLTRKEVHHRLTSAPSPFLITLPVRMALATSETPVLFADLSGYPDDTIADLASHYMNGLVDDFPQQQLLWKPPVLQRVALFMIHLAAGTGQMVSTVMPTAQATPRRSDRSRGRGFGLGDRLVHGQADQVIEGTQCGF